MSEANTTPVCHNISTTPECTVIPWQCGKCSLSQVLTRLSLYLSSNHMHGVKDVKVPKGLVLIFQAGAKYHFYPFQLSRLFILWINLFLLQISHWGPCEWMKYWWQSLGLGPQHQTLQGKAPNYKTVRAQLKGNDGSEKGKLGGEWMRRMGLREKSYSKETHQPATSSQRKKD